MSQPEPSLNDDAVHDLDPSFITPPNKEGEDKPLVNITATQNDFPQPSEMGEGELYKVVNDSEVLIKTVIDEQESVHDLEDVTKTIMAQETISASQVLAVDKSLGGKLTEASRLPLKAPLPIEVTLPKSILASWFDSNARCCISVIFARIVNDVSLLVPNATPPILVSPVPKLTDVIWLLAKAPPINRCY